MGVDEGNIQVVDGCRNDTVMENCPIAIIPTVHTCRSPAVVQLVTSKPSDVGT